ncbi:MAG: TipC family immunity protein [Oscillospiraceae bacterium]|nr:TipC family immunity protein [Oscillospiraceae bacterium]
MKKRQNIIFILITFVLLIGAISGIFYYQNNVRVQNVFEQLYRTRQNGFGNMSSTMWHQGMPDIQGGSYVRHQGQVSPFLGHFDELEINFGFPFDDTDTIMIWIVLNFPDDELIFLQYNYQRQNRELHVSAIVVSSPLYDREHYPIFLAYPHIIDDFLVRHNLARAEVEELHHWFLFEYFLPLWYETTQTRTRFSPDNWGEFSIVAYSR